MRVWQTPDRRWRVEQRGDRYRITWDPQPGDVHRGAPVLEDATRDEVVDYLTEHGVNELGEV